VESNQQTAKRIVVLGSSLSTRRVTSIPWDQLPEGLNVADYDVVIFNLVPALNKDIRDSIDFNKLPSPQQVTRLLFSKDSEILFIGPPTGLGEVQISATSFLPCVPHFIFESGEQIHDVDSEFTYFFQHVRHWDFYMETSIGFCHSDLKKFAQEQEFRLGVPIVVEHFPTNSRVSKPKVSARC